MSHKVNRHLWNSILKQSPCADFLNYYTDIDYSCGTSNHLLELTWLRDWDRPYNLGDNEFHLAFTADDFDAAHQKHADMGCICYENPKMGIYFINDPDNYWIEIVPVHR